MTKISKDQYNYLIEILNVADDKSESYLYYPIIRFSDDYSGELSTVLEITKISMKLKMKKYWILFWIVFQSHFLKNNKIDR